MQTPCCTLLNIPLRFVIFASIVEKRHVSAERVTRFAGVRHTDICNSDNAADMRILSVSETAIVILFPVTVGAVLQTGKKQIPLQNLCSLQSILGKEECIQRVVA